MVLKSMQLVGFVFGLVWFGQNGPLLNQYHKSLKKDIKKLYEVDHDDIELNYLPISNPGGDIEKYALNKQQKSLGFLFIKEVKACNLNGCSADKLLNNNLGSEYYDIAVLTNPQMDILKVKVLDYFSDYGYEIASKRYLKKFKNLNICDFNQSAPQVDGISGATISYNALIASMEDFCQLQAD